jgi:hypothetical protein
MQDKPNPNPDDPKREIPPMPSQVSGDNIIIMGDVRAGSVGSGSVTANYISDGDMVINNGTVGGGGGQDFAELLAQLKEMLMQAREKGEMDELTAKQAISQLDSAEKLVKDEKKPPKPELIRKLEAVAQIIDSAVDTFTQDGSVAMILIKALPIAVMLVRLAGKLF